MRHATHPRGTSFLAALAGLAVLWAPTWSLAVPPPATCGQVFLTNTDNELLRLARTARGFVEAANGQPAGSNRELGIGRRTPIGGLANGESLIGIDVRPATGVLYGVGRIGADTVGQLYTIDVTDGQAVAVGARAIPLSGAAFGFDFNPVPDLLRIVSDTGLSIRVRPGDGTVAGTDTAPAYPAMGDPNATRLPRVVAVAYTNPDTDLDTNTVLHDLDVNRAADSGDGGDVLAIQIPPNGGVLNTVGRLGVDADDLTAFDIGYDNEPLAAIRPAGSPFSGIYVIDLISGAAVRTGQVGKGELITGLAIQVGPVCVRSSAR